MQLQQSSHLSDILSPFSIGYDKILGEHPQVAYRRAHGHVAKNYGGKDMGLGLSLSCGIVQKLHGRIEVQSEWGKDTTFRVWLPVRHVEEAQQP